MEEEEGRRGTEPHPDHITSSPGRNAVLYNRNSFFPLEGRLSEIQRRDSEIPKILEVSISFITASCFSAKTKCATMPSNYWKRDTRIGYVNPKCYLLRRGSIRIADQLDKAKPCTIDRQFAVKQCLEEVASNLSVRIIKSILA